MNFDFKSSLSFNPVMWFVCKLCRETFSNQHQLRRHKVEEHWSECRGIKCIVFEEHFVDQDWIPPTPTPKYNPCLQASKARNENCTVTTTTTTTTTPKTDPNHEPYPDLETDDEANEATIPSLCIPKETQFYENQNEERILEKSIDFQNVDQVHSEAVANEENCYELNQQDSSSNEDSLSVTITSDCDLNLDLDLDLETESTIKVEILDYDDIKEDTNPKAGQGFSSSLHTTATSSNFIRPKPQQSQGQQRQNVTKSRSQNQGQSQTTSRSALQSQSKPLMCQICCTFHRTKGSLSQHIKNRHTNLRPFKCPHCPTNWKNQSSLKTHLVTHGVVTPHKCRFCGKSFSARCLREDHERTHTGDRPFKCHVAECRAAFTSKKILKAHMCNKHREELGLRQFVCPICGKTFGLKNPLSKHMNIHQMEIHLI